ncbi:hypothetical protein HAX54_027643, partial [Datura stramonium]|nr:hypothetical protein [Datura stramonium]
RYPVAVDSLWRSIHRHEGPNNYPPLSLRRTTDRHDVLAAWTRYSGSIHRHEGPNNYHPLSLRRTTGRHDVFAAVAPSQLQRSPLTISSKLAAPFLISPTLV